MSNLEISEQILKDLGVPDQYNSELMRLSFLALLNMNDSALWASASNNRLLRIHDVLIYIKDIFEKEYAENSRETLRKRVMRVLEQSMVIVRNIDDLTRSTNSGKTNYSITPEALNVIQNYGGEEYEALVKSFFEMNGSLAARYAKRRDMHRIPIIIDSKELFLSSGGHNELQKDIIEEFASRFAHGAKLLYVGDTADKYIYVDVEILEAIGIPISENDKLQLPDVVFYDSEKNWIYLVEAVTTHGPVDQKRIHDLEVMFERCPAEKIYVTAFPDRKTFRKYVADIAWETEVWISEEPDHMIHFNGDKFMGPYKAE